MTLGEHLAELRRRVVVSVVAFVVGATVAFVVYPHILHFLQAPYCRVAGRALPALRHGPARRPVAAHQARRPTGGCSWPRR